MECVTSYCTTHGLMNGISGEKRKSDSGAFKLKVIAFAENSGTRARSEYGISQKKCSGWLGLQSNAFILPAPCSMAVSSVQGRLGLAFASSHVGRWVPYLVSDSRCDLYSGKYGNTEVN